jgi:diguanylate cyclase (GGDEF)-like protein
MVIGLLAASFAHPVWLALCGVGILLCIALSLAQHWLWQPVSELVDHANRVCRPERPLPPRGLPIRRDDEVGQLARALHRVSVAALRDYHEAHCLRRTLDARVEAATRRATRQLERTALRDPLTDLANRRFLDQHLDPLVKSCRESRTDLSCIMIDVDGFKMVNDRLGHHAGDELLAFIASLVRSMVRGDDYAVRYGGDEFVILMPGANADRVRQFSDRLRELVVTQARHVIPQQLKLNLSMGVASLLHDRPSDGRELLRQADARLYEAKHAGKGRTIGLPPRAAEEAQR